jgi:nanoRNase/pAp phosphatase (c-di-AMP/oligoRNAs hydrolase)
MDSDKQQLIDKLKTANNILVTVSRNPSVDQLASCIGLTLLLNKQGKHAAAVFSGEVPSTLEFLDPGNTIEKNTDSLRDFIIALDKSKADKLRYKVEDNIVRIFITPYKTSISQADLEFSEGDFNVDVVVALGVSQQDELDEAITAHGRILHDATVTSINTAADSGLGTINWRDPQASSLSELVTQLAQALGDNLLDNQIATALLTGIVSETGRFSNDKTSSQAMSASAALMSAGANQQLVASKLEESKTLVVQNDASPVDKADKADDGTMRINHDDKATVEPVEPVVGDKPPFKAPDSDEGILSEGPKLVTEPPSLGGTLTANSSQEKLDPANDALASATTDLPPLLNHNKDSAMSPASPPSLTPPPAAWTPWKPPATNLTPPSSTSTPPPSSVPPIQPDDTQTLEQIEESVGSEHIKTETVEEARQEVDEALDGAPSTTMPAAPIEALGAQPMGGDLHPPATPPINPPVDDPPQTPQVSDPTAPPPVPPPIPFQFGNPSPPQ